MEELGGEKEGEEYTLPVRGHMKCSVSYAVNCCSGFLITGFTLHKELVTSPST